VIRYYAGDDVPVFLLTVFGKAEKVNLTKVERNALAGLTKPIPTPSAAFFIHKVRPEASAKRRNWG